MPQSKMSPRKVVAAANRERAIAMRKTGATYDEIGEALGVSKISAYKYVAHVLGEWRASCLENAAELMALEAARLDELQAAVWPEALKGDLKAVETVLKIMAQRARLFGLDKTTEIQVGDQAVTIRVVYETEAERTRNDVIARNDLLEGG